MTFDVAKKQIDQFLNNDHVPEMVIVDFIGGEPLLEIDLIDKICDYFKIKSFQLDKPCWWNYRFNIGTNGTMYLVDRVQKFLKKNQGKVSLGITLDGTKEKHDLMRVYEDGSGSYDVIIKGIPEYLKNHVPGTKVTFSSADLPLLYSSIVHLIDLGFTHISANVVFENVWKEGDDLIFEEQLKMLADYIIENNFYDKIYCTLFLDSIGGYLLEDDLSVTSCGSGKMRAFGPDGYTYPCMRFKDYSLDKNLEIRIGNMVQGIYKERLRPFLVATKNDQLDDECKNCPAARGCDFCQGFNYDDSSSKTIFSHAKYICNMHKARVRANDYYFSRLFNQKGIAREEIPKQQNKTYILLSNEYVDYCGEKRRVPEDIKMSYETLFDALEYSRNRFSEIFLVHDCSMDETVFLDKSFENYTIHHIIPFKKAITMKDTFNLFSIVLEGDEVKNLNESEIFCKKIILNISQNQISNLAQYIRVIFLHSNEIELNILGFDSEFDFAVYKDQIEQIAIFIKHQYEGTNREKKINVLSDLLYGNSNDCSPGDKSIAIAPNGNIYSCHYSYSQGENPIGSIYKDGIPEKNILLFQTKNPLCRNCNASQCRNCRILNRRYCGEYNVSPSFQCKKSNIERIVAARILNEVFPNTIHISDNPVMDPILNILDKTVEDRYYYE